MYRTKVRYSVAQGGPTLTAMALDSLPSPAARPRSRIIPGPPHLRYYLEQRLVAWQPAGLLNDELVTKIADWLLAAEKFSLPFQRYVDLTRLSHISLDLGHVFHLLLERTAEFHGATPVRTAFYGDQPPAFGLAQLWEALLEHTPVEARAFRNRGAAASWLEVPADILALTDEPASVAQVEEPRS